MTAPAEDWQESTSECSRPAARSTESTPSAIAVQISYRSQVIEEIQTVFRGNSQDGGTFINRNGRTESIVIVKRVSLRYSHLHGFRLSRRSQDTSGTLPLYPIFTEEFLRPYYHQSWRTLLRIIQADRSKAAIQDFIQETRACMNAQRAIYYQ